MLTRPLHLFAALALGCACAAATAAAEPNPPAEPAAAAAADKSQAPQYGTQDLVYVQVPGTAFFPHDSTTSYSTDHSGYHDMVLRRTTDSYAYFTAPISIPSGAIVKYVELDYCDDVGAAYVQGGLVQADYHGNVMAYVTNTSDTAGCTYVSKDATSYNIVVNNYNQHLWLNAYVSDSTVHDVGLGGMIVGYQLQVSPAPGTASFNDVPTSHPFFQFVEALADSGITAGCGNGNYCPDSPLTRGQMAVFLSKALGLHFR